MPLSLIMSAHPSTKPQPLRLMVRVFITVKGLLIATDGKIFSYKYITVNETDYRVPNSVLDQMKSFLESKPNITKFKVIKKGSGLNTQYQVLPLN